MNALLISVSAKVAKLILSYGICFAIIFVALIALATFKRKTKKEMRPQTIKARCEKAKKYAEGLLSKQSSKGAHLFLGSTKLMKLTELIEDASWLAFQVVDAKKDLVYEGIANALDGLATTLGNEFAQGYIPAEEYEKDIQKAIAVLETAIAKLDGLIIK